MSSPEFENTMNARVLHSPSNGAILGNTGQRANCKTEWDHQMMYYMVDYQFPFIIVAKCII